jgi:hypothetical protein
VDAKASPHESQSRSGSDAGDEERRVAVETVLPGLELHALPQGANWEHVFALIKFRDADGTGWIFRTSGVPNREELLGALQIQVELLKQGLIDDWDVE